MSQKIFLILCLLTGTLSAQNMGNYNVQVPSRNVNTELNFRAVPRAAAFTNVRCHPDQ